MLDAHNLNQINLSDYQLSENPLMPDLNKLDNAPDETWIAIEGKNIVACASLWFSRTLLFEDAPTAMLGHFYADNESAGAFLLEYLKGRANAQSVAHLIGPMNGDTWHSYRLLSSTSDVPPFLLDIQTPLWWNEIFQKNGFRVIKDYHSSGAYADGSETKFAPQVEKLGLTVRPFEIDNWQEELTRLHPLCCQGFSRNFLYTDIDLDAFIQMYQPVLRILDPNFFLIAEHVDKAVGFIFAYPNIAQLQRGETMDTLVLKTVVRSPKRTYAGLGAYLVHDIHARAKDKGFPHVIHAFIANGNPSSSINGKSARIIREYALYGVSL